MYEPAVLAEASTTPVEDEIDKPTDDVKAPPRRPVIVGAGSEIFEQTLPEG